MTLSMRILPACVALALALAAPARAEVYEWTDGAGRQHFTEDLERVPPDQRAGASERARSRPASRLQTYSTGAAAAPAAPAADPLPRLFGSRTARLGPDGGALRIPFTKRGTLMLVQATLNDHVHAPFLVDTGASGISIPDRVARELGVRIDADTPRLPVQTAAGLVAEPLIEIESIQVGSARVERIAALVNSSMDVGLLGGSFFNNFVYEVDAAAEVITLRPNDGVRGGLSELQWRERFRETRGELVRLERYLAENELARESRRAELERNLESLREAADALDREANAAGVPRSWRE
jgi:clan AA aspartic protease (TIGR02281 family)